MLVSLLERISHALGSLAGFICRLPQTLIQRTELRRLRAAHDVREAERLDRIRNPHKYRGR
jgi:hypothetical protein